MQESASGSSTTIPHFIQPKSIDQMTDDEMDEALEIRRQHRLSAFIIYQQTEEELKAVKEETAKKKLEKKLEQFYKQLESADRALDKLQKLVNDIRALKLVAGIL